ncbi:zinc finger CCHC domain-containing protein 12-like [Amphiura filiformis]|uniref:zinc finger CCHC domain-containing protein 12-like n=1 Tax=Amphiura filiformis TaxID=82378 RepID=UPI003B20EEB0
MSSSAKLVVYGLDWCKSQKLLSSHCILLIGRKTTISTGDIYKKLCYFFPVENVNRCEEEDSYGWMKTLVLVEMPVPTKEATLPKTVQMEVEGVKAEFQIVELNHLPSHASTPKSSASTAKPHPPSQTTPNKDLATTLSSLSLGINYRKLRVFSGDPERVKDEDVFTLWMTQARALVEEGESAVSEAEKKRRIREALRTPALDIIEDLRQENPKATAKDYLTALEVAFGTTLSGEELYHQFLNLDQNSGEKPSAYLCRLQASLRQVIQKDGVDTDQSNRVLLRQFIKGTLFDQMMLVDLHLRDKMDSPPTYLNLLSLVRRQEEEYFGRSKKVKATKTSKSVLLARQEADKSPSTSHDDDSLANRIARLEGMFKSYASAQQANMYQHQAADESTGSHTFQPDWEARNGGRPNFCYRCGEDGHMSRKCDQTADPEKVNKRLIKFLHQGQSGNYRRHQTRSAPMPKNH